MAHFAEINKDGMVLRVLVVDNENENNGQDFLANDMNLGGIWIQTSYNSKGGIHYLADGITPSGKPHLRYNYASYGYTYDSIRDAFIPPKPFNSWILDEETCWWKPPIPEPETGGPWEWDEELGEWKEIIP